MYVHITPSARKALAQMQSDFDKIARQEIVSTARVLYSTSTNGTPDLQRVQSMPHEDVRYNAREGGRQTTRRRSRGQKRAYIDSVYNLRFQPTGFASIRSHLAALKVYDFNNAQLVELISHFAVAVSKQSALPAVITATPVVVNDIIPVLVARASPRICVFNEMQLERTLQALESLGATPEREFLAQCENRLSELAHTIEPTQLARNRDTLRKLNLLSGNEVITEPAYTAPNGIRDRIIAQTSGLLRFLKTIKRAVFDRNGPTDLQKKDPPSVQPITPSNG